MYLPIKTNSLQHPEKKLKTLLEAIDMRYPELCQDKQTCKVSDKMMSLTWCAAVSSGHPQSLPKRCDISPLVSKQDL